VFKLANRGHCIDVSFTEEHRTAVVYTLCAHTNQGFVLEASAWERFTHIIHTM